MMQITDRVYEVSWDDVPGWDGEALYDSPLNAKVEAVMDYEEYVYNKFGEPGESSWYPVGNYYWHHCDNGLPTGVVIYQRPVYGNGKS